jgi:predicted nucleic acid-binding protein
MTQVGLRELRQDASDLVRRVEAAVAASGRQPRAGVMDLLIAATARTHSARLYTRNADDLIGADHLVEVVAV